MGALSGYKVIELAGIGPAPMGGMMLADMGAEVIRIERPGAADPKVAEPISGRNKKSVVLDLKQDAGKAALMTLIEQADALIDPYRPGVCEKLGFGPDECLARNPKLVFARMTGWGQTGPLAQAAGHDLNYIAITGALHAIGRRGERPVVPLNLVGDFGGGGMLLAFGVVCGILEAARSGTGQVIDAAMVDGSAVLMSMFWAFSAMGVHDPDSRGTNLLDTGAHFYDVYRCADDAYISIGSIEPQFYAELLRLLDLTDDPDFATQMDRAAWPALKERLGEIFASRTRVEWCELLEHTDVCFAPVLTMAEAAEHPHNQARGTFTEVAGLVQPAPAPRFSRTEPEVASPPAHPGQHTREALLDWGVPAERVESLLESGAARQA